ncbi:hypothetical protein R5W24_000745 [Gemmata sp. JC717]|uniref:hypothetical protein n=1 Tax=Gemmata algarum TaxID=2975278 RepID=UPI0021BACB08|nr:hypothetical protein [Gemmata algarum]MDY3551666.1 hypothetical protein [Gemmata algarum]
MSARKVDGAALVITGPDHGCDVGLDLAGRGLVGQTVTVTAVIEMLGSSGPGATAFLALDEFGVGLTGVSTLLITPGMKATVSLTAKVPTNGRAVIRLSGKATKPIVKIHNIAVNPS